MIKDKDISLIIAEEIKKQRKNKGLSQKELARKSRLSEDSVKQIENGKSDPPVFTIYKIAKALGVELSRLLQNL